MRKLFVRIAAVLMGMVAVIVVQAAPASAHIDLIGPGSTGRDVRIWQEDLNYFMRTMKTCRPTLTVDSDFGTDTTKATKCVQRVFGVDDDGWVGKDTLRAFCPWLGKYGADNYSETCSGILG